MTTLPQYKNYMVEDYTVEYDSRKNYDNLDLHIYLDIRLKERKYPTLEEFMNTYMKGIPESTKIDGENKYTSILVYKSELYSRSPDTMFKFRNYKVHRCYYDRINLGTKQIHVIRARHMLFSWRNEVRRWKHHMNTTFIIQVL